MVCSLQLLQNSLYMCHYATLHFSLTSGSGVWKGIFRVCILKDISVTLTSAFYRSRPCSSSMLPILSVSWRKPWWKLLWWEIAHNWLQRFSEFANWTNTSGFPPRGLDPPGSSTSYHRRARSCWSYRPVLGLFLLLRRRPSTRSWSSDGDVLKLFLIIYKYVRLSWSVYNW